MYPPDPLASHLVLPSPRFAARWRRVSGYTSRAPPGGPGTTAASAHRYGDRLVFLRDTAGAIGWSAHPDSALASAASISAAEAWRSGPARARVVTSRSAGGIRGCVGSTAQSARTPVTMWIRIRPELEQIDAAVERALLELLGRHALRRAERGALRGERLAAPVQRGAQIEQHGAVLAVQRRRSRP